jgi:type I restriction enzyme S subunit
MKWKPYPKYKDSGIEWLGEIPVDWTAGAIKRHFEVQLGKMLQNYPQSDCDELVPYVKAAHVGWGGVHTSDLPYMWASPEDVRQYGIRSGDLLVCKGGEVGRSSIVHKPPELCIIQNALHRVRGGDRAEIRYLDYVLRAVARSGWFDVLCSRATIAHFTREKLAALAVPLPCGGTQRAIAGFLDRETGRIDALIEKKERQIELLKEKRAALISHAVTKGLNPNAKMKDSGIEWLGKIPSHWEVRHIKNVGQIRYGLGEPPRERDDGLMFIRATDIHMGTIRQDTIRRIDPDDVPSSRDPLLQVNDILVVRSGAYTGDSAIVTPAIAGAIAGYDMILRVTSAAPKFVAYALLSNYILEGQIYLEKMRAAQPHLNAEELGNCIVMMPPASEQISIAHHLDKVTRRIDSLENRIADSVRTLREYRSALITAAVTGEIDVREEAA